MKLYPYHAIKPTAVLVVEAENRKFYAHIADNECSKAFVNKLNSDPLTVELTDNGVFGNAGSLPFDISGEEGQITTKTGDIVICGDTIFVCYGEGTMSGSCVASIGNVTGDEIISTLGEGGAAVSFYLEWSE